MFLVNLSGIAGDYKLTGSVIDNDNTTDTGNDNDDGNGPGSDIDNDNGTGNDTCCGDVKITATHIS